MQAVIDSETGKITLVGVDRAGRAWIGEPGGLVPGGRTVNWRLLSEPWVNE
jgi:hypothetical protein